MLLTWRLFLGWTGSARSVSETTGCRGIRLAQPKSRLGACTTCRSRHTRSLIPSSSPGRHQPPSGSLGGRSTRSRFRNPLACCCLIDKRKSLCRADHRSVTAPGSSKEHFRKPTIDFECVVAHSLSRNRLSRIRRVPSRRQSIEKPQCPPITRWPFCEPLPQMNQVHNDCRPECRIPRATREILAIAPEVGRDRSASAGAHRRADRRNLGPIGGGGQTRRNGAGRPGTTRAEAAGVALIAIAAMKK